MNNDFNGRAYTVNKNVKNNNNILIGVALAALAFFVFFIVLVIPFITSFIVSFKSFDFRYGAIGSPWVGMANFVRMFETPIMRNVISGTIVISALSTLVGTVYVFAMTYILSLIQNKWCKIITTAVIVLPIFVPDILLISVISKYIRGLLTDNALYVLAPMINDILTVSSVVILFGAFITMKNNSIKAVGFVTLSYVALKLLTFFSPDYEFISLSNSLVSGTAEVLDTFMFQNTKLLGDYSAGATIFIVRVLLQLIPTAIAIVAFMLLPKLLNNSHNETINKDKQSKNIRGIVAIIPLAVVIAVLVYGFAVGGEWKINVLFAVLSTTIVSCIVFVVFVFTLGYSFSTNNKIIIALTLLFTLIMNNVLGEHFLLSTTGIINTMFAVIVTNIPYCIFGVIMLYIALSSEKITSIKQYFRCSIGPIIALVGVSLGKFNSIALDQHMGNGLLIVSLVAITSIVVGLATTIVGLMLYYKTIKVEKEI